MSLLSKDKVAEIKGVLAQVNLTKLCQELEVKRRTVYGVLYGESSDYETLKKVVEAARKEIKKQNQKKQTLQSL